MRPSRRWIEHRRDLRRGAHGNPILQCAWNRYGESSFTFAVIERVDDPASLLKREQRWIDTLDATVNGYNVLPVAGSNLGKTHSEETKRKMSAAHKGRKHGPMSNEQKAYFSTLYCGRKLSDETRRRMSQARKGRVFSAESRAKMSAAHKGKQFSPTTRAKLAAAQTGRKLSRETRAKMSASHRNRLARAASAAAAAI